MMRTAAAAAFLLPAVLAIQKRKACPDLDLRCRTKLGAVVNCLEQDTSPTDTSDIIDATLATCITENNFACPTCMLDPCPLSYRCNNRADPAAFIKQTKRFEDFKNRIENEKGADELAVCSDALKTCLTTDSTTCQSAFDSCKAAAVSSMEGCGDDGDDVQCAQNVQDGAAREGLDLLKTCLNTTAASSTRKKTVRECGAEIRDALKERTGYQNISDSQAEALLRQGELDDFSSGLSDCRLQFDTAQSRRSCEIEKAKEFNPNITDIELGELRQELGKKRAAQGMKGCREQGGSNCFADASTLDSIRDVIGENATGAEVAVYIREGAKAAASEWKAACVLEAANDASKNAEALCKDDSPAFIESLSDALGRNVTAIEARAMGERAELEDFAEAMEKCVTEKQTACEEANDCDTANLDCEPDDQKVQDFMFEKSGKVLDANTARKLKEDAVGIAVKETMEACATAGKSNSICRAEAREVARKVSGKKSSTDVDDAELEKSLLKASREAVGAALVGCRDYTKASNTDASAGDIAAACSPASNDIKEAIARNSGKDVSEIKGSEAKRFVDAYKAESAADFVKSCAASAADETAKRMCRYNPDVVKATRDVIGDDAPLKAVIKFGEMGAKAEASKTVSAFFQGKTTDEEKKAWLDDATVRDAIKTQCGKPDMSRTEIKRFVEEGAKSTVWDEFTAAREAGKNSTARKEAAKIKAKEALGRPDMTNIEVEEFLFETGTKAAQEELFNCRATAETDNEKAACQAQAATLFENTLGYKPKPTFAIEGSRDAIKDEIKACKAAALSEDNSKTDEAARRECLDASDAFESFKEARGIKDNSLGVTGEVFQKEVQVAAIKEAMEALTTCLAELEGADRANATLRMACKADADTIKLEAGGKIPDTPAKEFKERRKGAELAVGNSMTACVRNAMDTYSGNEADREAAIKACKETIIKQKLKDSLAADKEPTREDVEIAVKAATEGSASLAKTGCIDRAGDDADELYKCARKEGAKAARDEILATTGKNLTLKEVWRIAQKGDDSDSAETLQVCVQNAVSDADRIACKDSLKDVIAAKEGCVKPGVTGSSAKRISAEKLEEKFKKATIEGFKDLAKGCRDAAADEAAKDACDTVNAIKYRVANVTGKNVESITDDDVKEIKNAARKDAIRAAQAAIKEAKETNSSYMPTSDEQRDIIKKFVEDACGKDPRNAENGTRKYGLEDELTRAKDDKEIAAAAVVELALGCAKTADSLDAAKDECTADVLKSAADDAAGKETSGRRRRLQQDGRSDATKKCATNKQAINKYYKDILDGCSKRSGSEEDTRCLKKETPAAGDEDKDEEREKLAEILGRDKSTFGKNDKADAMGSFVADKISECLDADADVKAYFDKKRTGQEPTDGEATAYDAACTACRDKWDAKVKKLHEVDDDSDSPATGTAKAQQERRAVHDASLRAGADVLDALDVCEVSDEDACKAVKREEAAKAGGWKAGEVDVKLVRAAIFKSARSAADCIMSNTSNNTACAAKMKATFEDDTDNEYDWDTVKDKVAKYAEAMAQGDEVKIKKPVAVDVRLTFDDSAGSSETCNQNMTAAIEAALLAAAKDKAIERGLAGDVTALDINKPESGKTWKKSTGGQCSALFVVRPKLPTGTDINTQTVQDKVAAFADDLKTEVPAKMNGGRRRLNSGDSVGVSSAQSSEMCTGSECDNNAEYDSSVTAAPSESGVTTSGPTDPDTDGGTTAHDDGDDDDDDDDDDGTTVVSDTEAAADMRTVHVASAVTMMVASFVFAV